MSTGNYSLQIVSKHHEFSGKQLKQYAVDGLATVGAWGNEPFEVVFKNNTWNKVQVKLSIDGTDILTGKPADTSATGDMWQVAGYGTLTLKAWPETNKGGAQFIFTSAEKSVAVNTHGDLSSRSIIAAAVYTENHFPYRIYHNNNGSINNGNYGHGLRRMKSAPTFSGNSGGGFTGTLGSNTGTVSSSISLQNCSMPAASNYVNISDASYSTTMDSLELSEGAADLKSLAAVGAGQHVEQNIQNVAGFISPVLGEIVRVRYQWWDELVVELKEKGIEPSVGSGFPGDDRAIMSIGSTPRIGQWKTPAFPKLAPQYARF